MRAKSSWSSKSVCYPHQENDLADLTDHDKVIVIRLLARVAERSYQRGYMQGAYTGRLDLAEEVRYWGNLDKSPCMQDGPHIAISSVDRLYGECPEIERLGLPRRLIREVMEKQRLSKGAGKAQPVEVGRPKA